MKIFAVMLPLSAFPPQLLYAAAMQKPHGDGYIADVRDACKSKDVIE
jgi:hypothetical protein